MYCLIRTSKSSNGSKPDLPENIGFLELAYSNNQVKYGLYECDFEDDTEFPESVEPVDEELKELLESAKDYPPALAIMRDEFRNTFLVENDKSSVINLITRILIRELDNQKHSWYFLAESSKSQIGYLEKGGFYWIIGYNERSELVTWVSRDYFAYQNPVDDFVIDRNWLFNRVQ